VSEVVKRCENIGFVVFLEKDAAKLKPNQRGLIPSPFRENSLNPR
jgi:hypothetical protein